MKEMKKYLFRAIQLSILSVITGYCILFLPDSLSASADDMQEYASAVDEEEKNEADNTLLRTERLFQPLIADPRWPHFSISYQYYIDDDELENVGSTTFGETLPFYRSKAPFSGIWQIGIQAAVFAIFDLDADSMDLINADYMVGIPVSYSKDDFSTMLRLFHQSSHLGDEFLLRSRIDRINLSYEAIDLRVSYDFPKWLRVYSGAGYLVRKDPDDLKRWSIQNGIELRNLPDYLGKTLSPVLAVDIKNKQESEWKSDVTLRFGVQIVNEKTVWNKVHLLLEYFNGRSSHGQFYERQLQNVSLGMHFYFE